MEKITDSYVLNGFDDRKHYLDYLAENYGVPKSTVYALASILGPIEDFDGLVVAVDDVSMGYL